MPVTADAPQTRATLAELAALREAATNLLAEITEHLAKLDRPSGS